MLFQAEDVVLAAMLSCLIIMLVRLPALSAIVKKGELLNTLRDCLVFRPGRLPSLCC